VLRAGYADRQWETDLVAYASADGSSYLSRCPEEADGAGNFEECLINRHPLDSRREVVKDRYDLVAKLLIAAEVATDETKITAKLAGTPPWHAAADAVAPGFVRCRKHHVAAYCDWPVPKGRVQQLLNRRIKGIEIGMQDRRPPDWRKFHS
jgi:hypothetical protein